MANRPPSPAFSAYVELEPRRFRERFGLVFEQFRAGQRFEHRPGLTDEGLREMIARRKETQPIGEWSCGSTFTNPRGDHAARLIEAAGLKGTRIGDVMVSPKHANFLVNVEAATAADVEHLVALVRQEVKRKFDVDLTPEFRTVGEPG